MDKHAFKNIIIPAFSTVAGNRQYQQFTRLHVSFSRSVLRSRTFVRFNVRLFIHIRHMINSEHRQQIDNSDGYDRATPRGKIILPGVSAAGLLIAIGIVFGDIGTSPLYVMKAILHVDHNPDPDYILGAVSCVIWTLTLQTTIKYVVGALRADNNGEGGIMALFSLIRRSLSKPWPFIVAAIGASALLADGIITPAMTVTSAVEGLRSLNPHTPVVPIVLVIITAVFFVQRSGTSTIGRFFGPVMLIWFLMLGVIGVMNIGADLSILKSFNPYYAFRLVFTHPEWMLILGAVFLCTTGAEALYSDLGHCGRWNITVSWCFVKVMLILNYLGQGAWILSGNATTVTDVNPFYGMMPHSFLGVGIVISTIAAIIASQALISGVFTLISEAINLDFWPRMRINHTGEIRGQMYVPAINFFLFAGCVLTVLLFRSSDRMEAAYGLAITATMLCTTVLLWRYMTEKGISRWITTSFLITFSLLETLFLVANLFKFVSGGWFTVLIACVLCSIMLIWNKGRSLHRSHIDYKDIRESLDIITDIRSDREIARYASNVVYVSFSPTKNMVESKVLYSIINKHPKRADHYWILRMCHTDQPDTLDYSVDTLVSDAVFIVSIRIGFKIQPQVNVFLRQIVEDLVENGALSLTSRYPSMKRRGIPGDFRFVLIHRVFSPSSVCGAYERRILTLYEILRRMSVSTERALGLDTSMVTVETVPLIIETRQPLRIRRRDDL